jgi:cytochrome bd ubiquinol oxidase subunit I
MEFQFGTNWAYFSGKAGGVIGQPLVMEGVFAFFLESAFLGLFLFGEKRLSQWGHFGAAFMVFLGSWISGYFIIVTNAWMQHPIAYEILPDGRYQVTSWWALLTNPWAVIQYAHNMSGAMITGSFVIAGIGAYYLLSRKHEEFGRVFVRVGVISAAIFSVIQLFPTGDLHGKMVAKHQPITTAAMEGLWATQQGAPMVIMGQPDPQRQRIDNPIFANKVLSYLIYGTTTAEVKGLDAFPKDDWPDNIELLYYSYHIMAGLGTIFIASSLLALILLWQRKLYTARWMLWILLLLIPFPYIANTAGWMTAELGRQPWLIYGLMRTAEGASHHISAGNAWFTLLGYMGMYSMLSILFLFLIQRIVARGPGGAVEVH